MILGADPEAKPEKVRQRTKSKTVALLNYFRGNTSRPVDARHEAALVSTISKLLKTYDSDDILEYIDRYLAHDAAKGSSFPMSFCSHALQAKLLGFATKASSDDVDRWIEEEFVRTDDMVLPWEPHDDKYVRAQIIRHPHLKDEIVDEFRL